MNAAPGPQNKVHCLIFGGNGLIFVCGLKALAKLHCNQGCLAMTVIQVWFRYLFCFFFYWKKKSYNYYLLSIFSVHLCGFYFYAMPRAMLLTVKDMHNWLEFLILFVIFYFICYFSRTWPYRSLTPRNWLLTFEVIFLTEMGNVRIWIWNLSGLWKEAIIERLGCPILWVFCHFWMTMVDLHRLLSTR